VSKRSTAPHPPASRGTSRAHHRLARLPNLEPFRFDGSVPGVGTVVVAFVRLDGCDEVAVCCQVSSKVRFCAIRIQCLILAKTCSTGLKSREQRCGHQSLVPAARIVYRTAADLCEPRLSHDSVATTSPPLSCPRRERSIRLSIFQPTVRSGD